jgi:hypothetical protein
MDTSKYNKYKRNCRQFGRIYLHYWNHLNGYTFSIGTFGFAHWKEERTSCLLKPMIDSVQGTDVLSISARQATHTTTAHHDIYPARRRDHVTMTIEIQIMPTMLNHAPCYLTSQEHRYQCDKANVIAS